MPKIIINGIIWSGMIDDIREQLEGLEGKDITVEISSPGGFVFPGFAIYNILKNHSGNVTTHLMGLAASMASYIALAGDTVKAESNSVFMIHNVQSFVSGDHNEMNKEAQIVEGLSNLIAKVYAAKTGKELSEIRRLMDDETFLFGDEAKKAGFVDEIIKSPNKKKPKNEAISEARAQIQECINQVKSKNEKLDIEKAAAYLEFDKLNFEGDSIKLAENKSKAFKHKSKNDLKPKKSKGEKMDLTTLKSDHPEVYNAVFEEGKKAGIETGIEKERDRVTAHLKLGKAFNAMDYAAECIESGVSTFQESVSAEYHSRGMNNQDLDDREKDNQDSIDTDEGTDPEKAQADLLANVMAHSKRDGAPIQGDA